MLKYTLLLILISACSSHETQRLPSSTPYQTSWQDYLLHNYIEKGVLEKYYPDPDYMGPWQIDDDFVLNKPIPPYKIQEKAYSCRTKKLYPTHPSQGTKEYLHAIYSQYENGRIPPTSYACLRKNPTGRFCVMAAIAIMVVLSDIYEDDCGNFYRGYWLVTYLKSDENMGTLFAKGRSAFAKPNSEFKGEFIEDGTYFVPVKDFMILGELLPGDMAKMKVERDRALRSGFKMNGKLFVR